MQEKDYYEVLGLGREASADEVRKAYRKLALESHPDRHPEDGASEEKFKEIGEAYAVLSDPEKRKEYDRSGYARFRGRYGSEDIFRNFDFGEVFKTFGMGFEPDSFRRFFCGRRGRGCGRRKASYFGRGFSQGSVECFPEREAMENVYELQLTRQEASSGTDKQVIVETGEGQRRFFMQIPPGIRSGDFVSFFLDDFGKEEIRLRVRIL